MFIEIIVSVYKMKSFLEELKETLEKSKDKRIVVVGTTCTGKSTILNSINCGLDKSIFV